MLDDKEIEAMSNMFKVGESGFETLIDFGLFEKRFIQNGTISYCESTLDLFLLTP